MGDKEVELFDDVEDDIFTFDEKQMSESVVLRSSKEICNLCNVGHLKPDGPRTQIVVYGRDGPKLVYHQPLRCNFRNKFKTCRAGHNYGFSSLKGMRIYDDDALRNEILLVSRQSAFTIEFLVELTGQVDISSETFEAAAKRYNRFHSSRIPMDVENKRVELCKKTLRNAYSLFCYLEICQ